MPTIRLRLKTRLFQIAGLFLVLVAGISIWVFTVTPTQRAERAKINEHGFALIMTEAGWDITKNMQWGFYFTNKSKFPLNLCYKVLGFAGFRYVDIRFDEDSHLWWLHMERTEIHDADSLSTRDVRLSRVAKLSGGCNYDGWDVGPAN